LRSPLTKLEKEFKAYLEKIRDIDGELLREAISTIGGARQIPIREVEVILDYCLAIKTVLKMKSVYPLKPGGLRLYQKLKEIRQSLMNCRVYVGNFLLEKLLELLTNVINEFEGYVKHLEISYQWIHRIATRLNASSGEEVEAQQSLVRLIDSFGPQNETTLSAWLSHMKRVTGDWLPWLFKYLSQPLLPKTNNDLEAFNGKVKKTHRKITGRKHSQNFVARFGEPVAVLLSMPKDANWQLKFSLVPYRQFRTERERLAQNALRSKLHKIRRDLSDYLFDLELRWSHGENN
jgi:hypothetical protein